MEPEAKAEQETNLAVSHLLPSEAHALAVFQKTLGYKNSSCTPLAETTVSQLFGLFVAGKTLAEIRKMNLQFTLGQIVYASVQDNWVQKRQEHLDLLMQRSLQRAIQTQGEAIQFVADLITAEHTKYRNALDKALQTGDTADMKDFSLRYYKDALVLLREITGQSSPKEKAAPPQEVAPQQRAQDVRAVEAVEVVDDNPLRRWAEEKKLGEK